MVTAPTLNLQDGYNQPYGDYDLAELRRTQLPPRPVIIPGLLPVGVTVLSASAKIGKSWLAFQLEHYLAYHVPVPHLPDPDTERRRCLVIDLEGDAYGSQERSLALAPAGTIADEPGWIHITHAWPGESFAERLAALDRTLERWKCSYVRLDTLRLFLGPRPAGANAYESDAERMAALDRLARRHGTAILALHHIRKGSHQDRDWIERASGSMGIAGSVSALWYLERMRGSAEGLLHLTGRGLPERELAVTFTENGWRFDDGLAPAQVRRKGLTRAIVNLLAGGERTLEQLCEELRLELNAPNVASVARLLRRLAEDEDVETDVDDDGVMTYRLTDWNPPERTPPPAARDVQDVPLPEHDVPARKDGALAALKDSLNRSRAKPVPFIRTDQREQRCWILATDDKGASEGRHDYLAPDVDPDTQIVVLDRNGSYPSAASSVPVAANILTREEQPTYRRTHAGIYLISPPPWTRTDLPHPLGKDAALATVTVTRSHLDLFESRRLPYQIHEAYTGPVTTSLFEGFGTWARTRREQLAPLGGDNPDYLAYKNDLVKAIRLVWPTSARSPIWRPDWWLAWVGQANVRHWVRGQQAVGHGARLLAMRNVDEAIYAVPAEHAGDPDWVPRPYVVGWKFGEVKIKYRGPWSGYAKR